MFTDTNQPSKLRPPALSVAVALVLSSLSLVSCAGKQEGVPWSEDRQFVMDALNHLDQAEQRNAERLASMEERLVKLEEKLTKQGTEQEAEKATLLELQAEVKSLKRSTAKTRRSNRITKQKLVKKLDRIAKTITVPATTTPVPTPVPAPVIQQNEAEKNAYTAAYLALKSGRFDEAIKGFRDLLHDYPKGKFADQAWYWLGESEYAKRDSKAAIHAWKTVIDRYPASPKHAAAMLKLGIALKQQGKTTAAKQMWQRLIQQHPDSPAAENARRQLKALSGGK